MFLSNLEQPLVEQKKYFEGTENLYPSEEEDVTGEPIMGSQVKSKSYIYNPLVENARESKRLSVPVKTEFGQSSENILAEEYRNSTEVRNNVYLQDTVAGEQNKGRRVKNKPVKFHPKILLVKAPVCSRMGVPVKSKLKHSSESRSRQVYRKYEDVEDVENFDPLQDKVDVEQNLRRLVEHDPYMYRSVIDVTENSPEYTRLEVPVNNEFDQSSENRPTEKYREDAVRMEIIEPPQVRVIGEQNKSRMANIEPDIIHHPPTEIVVEPDIYLPEAHTGCTRDEVPISSVRTERGKRTSIKPNQLEVLERRFQMSKYINIPELNYFSRITGISEKSIKIWFQNRRATQKKEMLAIQTSATGSSEERRLICDTMIRRIQRRMRKKLKSQSYF